MPSQRRQGGRSPFSRLHRRHAMTQLRTARRGPRESTWSIVQSGHGSHVRQYLQGTVSAPSPFPRHGRLIAPCRSPTVRRCRLSRLSIGNVTPPPLPPEAPEVMTAGPRRHTDGGYTDAPIDSHGTWLGRLPVRPESDLTAAVPSSCRHASGHAFNGHGSGRPRARRAPAIAACSSSFNSDRADSTPPCLSHTPYDRTIASSARRSPLTDSASCWASAVLRGSLPNPGGGSGDAIRAQQFGQATSVRFSFGRYRFHQARAG